MLQEAAFVLLHIEGREKAIKDLLARSAPKIDEWVTRGLALYALDTGDIYNAYELYLSAGLYKPAHNIAVLELAPDAILRRDLDLLRDIFERFEGKEGKIDGWSIRGEIILDYVHIMHRLAGLQEDLSQDRASLVDTSSTRELDDLTRRVLKVLGLLPDVMAEHWY
ncbi:hypothetical protein M378DRAFT_11701 [Amanita muscaria Koide BX008]|uniref:Uncharacterized protein n=1 Tax=Amanita muscaria (strain Koide BX008) TaxID=946122 RepID=A0A0C2SLT0_AMAMK|nr:hypothetical protein M378DRAFT_11701 [Amanita muscaria Koide BX008]